MGADQAKVNASDCIVVTARNAEVRMTFMNVSDLKFFPKTFWMTFPIPHLTSTQQFEPKLLCAVD